MEEVKVEHIVQNPVPNFDEEENKKVTREDLQDYIILSKSFYAGFWLRALAYVIDVFVVSALGALLNTVTFGALDLGYEIGIIDKALPVVIMHGLYFVFLTHRYGQTLGKMIVGIRVESNLSSKVKFVDIIFREIIGRLFNMFFAPLYLIVAFTKKKKGLHDYIADTLVIKEDYSEIRAKLNKKLQENRSA